MKAVIIAVAIVVAAGMAGCAETTAPPGAVDQREIVYTGISASRGTMIPWYLVRADGTDERMLIDRVGDFAWAPDGERIAYWYHALDFLTAEILDVRTGGITLLSPAARGMRWSPDGSRIAYIEEGWGSLRVVGADGSGDLVVAAQSNATRPRWSPDGSRLLFIRDHGSMKFLEIVQNTGGDIRRLAVDSMNVLCADWSPDGTEILVCSGGSLEFDNWNAGAGLYRVPAEGGQARPIVLRETLGSECFVTGADWSSAGIMFVTRCVGVPAGFAMHAHVIEPSGSGLQQLASVETGFDVLPPPQWSSDGSFGAFAMGGVLYVYEPDHGTARAVPTRGDVMVQALAVRPVTRSGQ